MPRRDFGQIASNTLELLESPLSLLPGMEPVYAVHIAGEGEIDEDSLSMKLYKGTKDISGTNLSGTLSVRDRTILLKKITGLTAGDYVFYVYFTDGGILTGRFCRFYVTKEGA